MEKNKLNSTKIENIVLNILSTEDQNALYTILQI